MNEAEQTVEEAPAEEAKKPSGESAAAKRAEKQAASLRERLVREEQDEITVAFDSYAELRKSVDAALKAVDKAIGQCAAVEQKCAGYVGRRVSLGRRLFMKPVVAVLRTAHFQLRRAVAQMDAAARTRDDVLEAVVDPDVAR